MKPYADDLSPCRKPRADALRTNQLEAENAELKAALKAALELIAKLQKNSSKPPSSDITKPKPAFKERKKKRKRGGQKGRKACVRVPFPADQIDASYDHTWEGLDPRRYRLLPGQFSVDQQVELLESPYTVTEHRFQKYRDLHTGKIVTTPRPDDVRLGLFGPRLLAFVACLKADLHGSYTAIQTVLNDVMNIRVCRGYLVKAMGKVARALDVTYDMLKAFLRREAVVHVDETGHKENGKRWWTWVGTSRAVTVFQIVSGRGSAELTQLLGEDFDAVLCSDSFSAYLKYAKDHPEVKPQFCWAHLIRDLRFMAESADRLSQAWAGKVMGDVKQMFRTWHRNQFIACRRARDAILKRCRVPGSGAAARTLGGRIWRQREGYMRFLENPAAGIEPTNNPADRALRPLVLHRAVTQGTRSASGRRWWERVFSVRATCRQQGRSLFAFLIESLNAMAGLGSTPKLV